MSDLETSKPTVHCKDPVDFKLRLTAAALNELIEAMTVGQALGIVTEHSVDTVASLRRQLEQYAQDHNIVCTCDVEQANPQLQTVDFTDEAIRYQREKAGIMRIGTSFLGVPEPKEFEI